MVNYYLHNSTYAAAEVVILGVADNSGSRSTRKKGVEQGPDYIRRVSRKLDMFGKGRKVQSQQGLITAKVCDMGNVKKKEVSTEIQSIIADRKFPIILGGDHSITAEVIRGISGVKKNISLIYFDAHPDYRCGHGTYYGSVLCEAEKAGVDMSKSVLIGMRHPEKEELVMIKKSKMLIITPLAIEKNGVEKVFEMIRKRIGRNSFYMSLDMDVLDPAFAPGVETPVAGGLSSMQLLSLVTHLVRLNLVGCDIMEVNPLYDAQNITGHLASRIIAETVAHMKR